MTDLEQDCLLLKASFWPMRQVFCLNLIELKSTCIFSFNASKTKASVFSRSPSAIPCSKRQLRRKYCYYCYLSTIFSCFSIFSFILNTSFFTMSIILSFSSRSRLYSSNLLVIQLIASLKKFSWFSPLIWLFLNCYTVFWLPRFGKNICTCGIHHEIVQAGLSRSLWIISIIELAAQILLFCQKILLFSSF